MTAKTKPFVLIVRDGWGYNPDSSQDAGNATKLALTPVDDALRAKYANTLIQTSGEAVGLPDGTMGNSEVGHQNLGAGRIVYQESVRLTLAIRNGEFFENAELVGAVKHCLANKTKLHVMGLASDIGVHALLTHLYATVELAGRHGLEEVYVHAFGDGRDSPPHSGKGYLTQIETKLAELGVGKLASVCGRYYAMDRNNSWDRVEKAYRMLTLGEGWRAADGPTACQQYYDKPTGDNMIGDEFIHPTLISDDGQRPRALVESGDAVIFFNFRGDRPREIIRAFQFDTFPYNETRGDGSTVTLGFDRPTKLDLFFVGLTEYEKSLPVRVAFPKPAKMVNIAGEYFSARGMKQFRGAETEKYAHVTFFFNDYREAPFEGEDRMLVPSPNVPTYDQQPEMSAYGVAEEAEKRIRSGQYDFALVNFANPDMVGHTGVLDAAVKACEVVDACVGRLVAAVQAMGGSVIVTADHGNFEKMIDPTTGGPHTAHTVGEVPLIVVDDRYAGKPLREGGSLADVMPTMLELMGLPVPEEMTGRSLLVE